MSDRKPVAMNFKVGRFAFNPACQHHSIFCFCASHVAANALNWGIKCDILRWEQEDLERSSHKGALSQRRIVVSHGQLVMANPSSLAHTGSAARRRDGFC